MTFKQPHRIWQPLAAFAALILLVSAPAQAAVQEIRVLATGVDRSSVRAAELALSYAKQRAVYIVARKMQVEDAAKQVAALKPDQWKDIVRGATVLQTRREGEITYADVTVSVVDEALRRALGVEAPAVSAIDEAGAPRGVMVMPVFIGDKRPYLWEKENLVNEPMRDEVLRQGRGSVMVPAGDFDDRRLIDYQNALEVTAEQLQPMFKRYGLDEVIIAVVTLGAPATLEPTTILLRRLVLPPATSRVEAMTLKPVAENETQKMRAQKAAAAVASAATQIAGSTSKLDQARLKGAPTVAVTFRYATARELGSMQEAVRTVPGVLQLVMPAISLTNMSGILYLSGSKDEIRAALKKQGLVIVDDGEGWLISVR